MSEQYVILLRHGDKDGDRLTGKGVAQINATMLFLVDLGYDISGFFYSGLVRTAQCAAVGIQATRKYDMNPKREPGISYEEAFKKAFNNDMDAYKEDLKAVNDQGGTVGAAMKVSLYTQIARPLVITAVKKMAGPKPVVGFSHSPLVTFAAPKDQLDTTPYNVEEGDAIIYRLLDGEIESCHILSCPFK